MLHFPIHIYFHGKPVTPSQLLPMQKECFCWNGWNNFHLLVHLAIQIVLLLDGVHFEQNFSSWSHFRMQNQHKETFYLKPVSSHWAKSNIKLQTCNIIQLEWCVKSHGNLVENTWRTGGEVVDFSLKTQWIDHVYSTCSEPREIRVSFSYQFFTWFARVKTMCITCDIHATCPLGRMWCDYSVFVIWTLVSFWGMA